MYYRANILVKRGHVYPQPGTSARFPRTSSCPDVSIFTKDCADFDASKACTRAGKRGCSRSRQDNFEAEATKSIAGMVHLASRKAVRPDLNPPIIILRIARHCVESESLDETTMLSTTVIERRSRRSWAKKHGPSTKPVRIGIQALCSVVLGDSSITTTDFLYLGSMSHYDGRATST